MVVEALSNYTTNRHKYLEKTEFTYKKIKTYWLINKIKQTIRKDGRDIILRRFKFIDYKISSSD